MQLGENFEIVPGDPTSAYILHVPHSARHIPAEIREKILLTDDELKMELDEMTDTYTEKLARDAGDQAKSKPWLFINKFSRLVVDPERFPDHREPMNDIGMGAVYRRTSKGAVLRTISAAEELQLLTQYFFPYAQAFEELVNQRLAAVGEVVILDIHSYRPIPHENSLNSHMARPAICIGVDEFHTPKWLLKSAQSAFSKIGSTEINQPYAGTYVPLSQYESNQKVSSLMMENRADTFLDPNLALTSNYPRVVSALAQVIDREKVQELLNENSVKEYLIARGLYAPSSTLEIETLTGGISNVVFGVSDGQSELVLKQALPELLVPTQWEADQRRTVVEANAMEAFYKMTPGSVPRLIDSDVKNYVVTLERASRSASVWKDDLLSGVVNVDIARQLGTLLADWHKLSALDFPLLEQFREDRLFEQLRIEPFYRSLIPQYPAVANRIEQLISELQSSHRCLVHGDFSPKNILVLPNNEVMVLDFEVAHSGAPVFDLAFLLAHLLCKFEYFAGTPTQVEIAHAAINFMSAYETQFEAPAETLGWHVALLALARIDGVSKVHYLDLPTQARVRKKTLTWLGSKKVPSLAQLFKD